jgi:hypothetical protein
VSDWSDSWSKRSKTKINNVLKGSSETGCIWANKILKIRSKIKQLKLEVKQNQLNERSPYALKECHILIYGTAIVALDAAQRASEMTSLTSASLLEHSYRI